MTKLFPVIRAAFGIESFDISLSPEEYEKLIAFGKKQSILPVIYAGMKRMDTPVDILKTADFSRNQDLRRYVLYHDALGKICRALDDAGIDYIPLKGSVLCNLYPVPEMRTSSDIDVLVREEDLDRAVRTIESATDFKMDHRAYHDISMLNSSVHLELHFSLKENAENIDKILSRASSVSPFARARRVVGLPAT